MLPERDQTAGRPARALHYRDFRLLWGGQLVSVAGSRMQVVAVNVQVYQLARQIEGANPALYLGTIGLMQMIPLLLFGLWAGVIADRVDRRRLIMLTQVILMLLSLALAALTFSGAVTLPLLYVIIALAAATRSFETPARQALVPLLVPRAVLPNALSLNMAVWQAADIIGPALAGLLIAQWSVGVVYVIDAVSYGAVLVALALMAVRSQIVPRQAAVISEALEGLRFVRSSPIILATMVLDFVATFFGAAMTLLPLFADQVLHVDAQALGWMYAAPAMGALLAAIAMSHAGEIRRQGRVVLVAVCAYGLATALFGLSRSLPLTLLALAGTGVADTVSAVLRGTIRQISTPDNLRGRATSVNMLFFMGGPRLGEFEAGLAATAFGAPLSIALGGMAVVLAAAVIAWRMPSLRRYDR